MHLAQLFAVFLVMGGAYSAPVLSHGDLHDFADVIPVEKVWMVVSDYIAYDGEIQNMLGYVHTDEFKGMIRKIDSLPDFIQFLNSLEESGFPAYKYWNIIHAFLGMATVNNPNQTSPPQLSGGVAGLVNDVRALVKEGDVIKVYEEKLKSNPRLRSLVQLFQGETFKKVLGELASLPEVSTLLEKAGLSDRE